MNKPWPTKKLGEIAEIYSGGRSGITKKDYIEKGFPAFSAAGQDGFTKEAYDSGFAVILSSIGSRCGKCFYAEGEWTALANTQIIKFENPVTAKFMYHYLNDANKWPKTGTGQPFISPSVVKNLIALFPPLLTQQKIVKILDTIQEAVEIQEKIIEKTKELKKSLMAELFNYGGPSYRKGRGLKKTEIGEILENWEVVRLEEVCKLRKEQNFPNSSDKYVGLEHLDSGEICIRRYGLGSEVTSLKNKFYPDDILYGKLRPYLDKAAIANFEGVCSTDLLVINVNKNKISPFYLIELMHTKRFLSFTVGTMSGTNHPRTSWDFLKNFQIPLPPLPEQQEVVEILQTIDKRIEIEKKKKGLYEELFRTTLNKIMNQEIDVEKIKI